MADGGGTIELHGRSVFALGALATLLPEPLRAMPYQYPLNSTTIRDASFLRHECEQRERAKPGRSTATRCPDLAAGTNVPQVSMVTPYLRVAERCAQGPHYNNQDGMQDFLGRPVTVLVRLDLYFTPVLTNAEIDDSGDVRVRAIAPAQDLKIALIQNDEEVKPDRCKPAQFFRRISMDLTLAAGEYRTAHRDRGAPRNNRGGAIDGRRADARWTHGEDHV